jgi:threonine/homoserine/homoserine lactone efflux protein
MVSPDRLLAFAAMSFLLIVVPGPSVLFTVGRALAHGRRAALSSVAGNAVGAYVLVVAVAFGVGALVERSVVAFTVLKLAGAAYLVHLGIKAWRQRGSLPVTIDGEAPRGGLHTLWDGFAVGVANPKTIVFFVGIALASDSAWGLGASVARDWFARSPRRLAAVGRIGGLSMIGLGVTVAVTGRKD